MHHRHHFVAALAVLAAITAGCGAGGSGEPSLVVRSPDDVQVLTPAEVAAMREDAIAATGGGSGAGGEAAAGSDGGTTIPLAGDTRSPGQRLFDAYSDFSRCLEDRGQPFRGDPRSDPALLQDAEYMDAITTCATRSDILGALEEFQRDNANLTPEEVQERNEQFLLLEDCLERRGWTVDAAPNEDGLLVPSSFQSAEGDLDERDLRQCGNEVELDG